jgi:hypothetical protein
MNFCLYFITIEYINLKTSIVNGRDLYKLKITLLVPLFLLFHEIGFATLKLYSFGPLSNICT